jgi:hypothetical protein
MMTFRVVLTNLYRRYRFESGRAKTYLFLFSQVVCPMNMSSAVGVMD